MHVELLETLSEQYLLGGWEMGGARLESRLNEHHHGQAKHGGTLHGRRKLRHLMCGVAVLVFVLVGVNRQQCFFSSVRALL